MGGCIVNQLSNDITQLLDMALDHEQIARAYRKQAGRILAQAKANNSGGHWQGQFDSRTADLLVNMAIGRG